MSTLRLWLFLFWTIYLGQMIIRWVIRKWTCADYRNNCTGKNVSTTVKFDHDDLFNLSGMCHKHLKIRVYARLKLFKKYYFRICFFGIFPRTKNGIRVQIYIMFTLVCVDSACCSINDVKVGDNTTAMNFHTRINRLEQWEQDFGKKMTILEAEKLKCNR